MDGELGSLVRSLFADLDAKAFDRIKARLTEDAQGVDEISRAWLRGRDDVDRYFRGLEDAIQDIRSEVGDLRESIWTDAGVVTCWLEQDYTYQGEAQHISAPTTVAFRRDADEWRIALLHSVPLPEAAPA